VTDITEAQAAALRARLGADIPVVVGMRNWRPFISDALAALAAAGVTRVIGIPMAPQFSTLSVQKYIDAAARALPDGVQFDAVESFHTHPLLLDAFAERVRAAQPKPAELVVFTAHSLPVRAIESGDRYGHQFAETARRRRSAGITHYDRAFQSAGRTTDRGLDRRSANSLTIGRYHQAVRREDHQLRRLGLRCAHALGERIEQQRMRVKRLDRVELDRRPAAPVPPRRCISARSASRTAAPSDADDARDARRRERPRARR